MAEGEGRAKTWWQARVRVQGTALYKAKPTDFMRLIRCGENSTGKPTPMIRLPPTRSFPRHVEIMRATIRDEIRVGTQPDYIRVPM